MRRMRVLLLGIALAGAAVVAGSAVGGQALRPRLVLAATDPVTLRGIGFKPAERVRLTVTAGSKLVRRVTTSSAAGRFTVSIPSLDANDCTGFSATATGARGDRAIFFKRPPGVCALP